jgi:hypothetical protein
MRRLLDKAWRERTDKFGRFANKELGIVTTAGVNYLALAFANTGAAANINFHACGTGQQYGSASATVTGMGGSSQNPLQVTLAGHGLTQNDIIQWTQNAVGETAANGANWEVNFISSSIFSLIGATGNGTWSSAGTFTALNTHSDTALTTENDNGSGGTTRVAGAQTTPGSTNIYQSVATLAMTGSAAITEWGILSAASSGTLWDRRWFNTAQAPQSLPSAALVSAPINVQNGDSIAFTYRLTVNSGGS